MSFWACMTLIFHAGQFYINSEHIWHILRAKKFDWFFTPFFTTRLTFEFINNPPLRVIPAGSVMEYLPVRPEVPEITPYPSPVQCSFFITFKMPWAQYFRFGFLENLRRDVSAIRWHEVRHRLGTFEACLTSRKFELWYNWNMLHISFIPKFKFLAT